MKKEEIIKILESELLEQGYVQVELPYENGFDKVAERIVKLFDIPDVVWQSEQLKAYAQFLANKPAFQNYCDKDLAIDYCDSL